MARSDSSADLCPSAALDDEHAPRTREYLAPGFFGVAGTGDAASAFTARANAAGAKLLAQDPRFAFLRSGAEQADIGCCQDATGACLFLGEIYAEPLLTGTAAARHLLAAHTAGGPDGWSTLDGIFACVLWDAQRAELHLYRDATTGADLFWARLDGTAIVFATRLAHLRALVPAARRIEPRSLHEYLRFLDVSPPHTIHCGVSAVEPGGFLHWRRGTPTTVETAEPIGPAQPTKQSLQDSAAGFEARLARAVAERIPPEGTFASFLSGGLDSSLICALAQQIAPDRVETVTLGFHEADQDESVAATKIAQHLGVRHRVLLFSLDDYHDAFPDWIATLDFPYGDPTGLPTFLAYQQVRQRHAVALDGTGADTLLGIMPARYVRLATQYVSRLPVRLRTSLARLLGTVKPLLGYRPLFDFDEPEELLIRWKGWTRREIEVLLGTPVSFAHTRSYRLYRSFPPHAHLERYSALLGSLPDDRVHQSAGATGLRIRLPYLARAVQDYVRALPVEHRYGHGEPKRLLRAVLARHVPPALSSTPKHGFDFPLAAFLRHRDHALVHRCVERTQTIPDPLFDPELVRDCCQRLIAGDDRLIFKVWALVVFQSWYDATLRNPRIAGD